MSAPESSLPAQWPKAGPDSGMYESFYMRAIDPDGEVGIWIRYTVQKAPGRAHRASLWFTLFDPAAERPVTRKATVDRVAMDMPKDGWISIGQSSIGPGRLVGEAGDARWSLRVRDSQARLRHLPRNWMYGAPLPKTKPESPAPFARFEGEVEVAGSTYELDGWPGMLGHNWGSEHAWTWVWLSGTAFDGEPDAWIDAVMGRVKFAGRLTPWVANGAISLDGNRHRLGGLLRRGVSVEANPEGARLSLPGAGGISVDAEVEAPLQSTVGWQYGSPDGYVHDVVNCSIAPLRLDFDAGDGRVRKLSTGHGGTYELGLPEPQGRVELEPMPDDW